MPTLKRLRDIRELELFLFAGVPEVPESIYEVDALECAPVRTTGHRATIKQLQRDVSKDRIVGHVKINYETGQILIRECDGEEWVIA